MKIDPKTAAVRTEILKTNVLSKLDNLIEQMSIISNKLRDIQYALIYENYASINDWAHELYPCDFYSDYEEFVSLLKKAIPALSRYQDICEKGKERDNVE